jgi:hypothetical protein
MRAYFLTKAEQVMRRIIRLTDGQTNRSSQASLDNMLKQLTVTTSDLRSQQANIEQERCRQLDDFKILLSKALEDRATMQRVIQNLGGVVSQALEKADKHQEPQLSLLPGDVTFKNLQVTSETYELDTCTFNCTCSCHDWSAYRISPFLGDYWGAMYVGFTGGNLLGQKCNLRSCAKQSTPIVSIVYHFPHWLLMRALFVSISAGLSPAASLKFPRIVPFDAEIFHFIREGNLRGINSLFSRRVASPFDIYATDGCTTLHTAISFRNIAVCKLLLSAGADPLAQRNGPNAMYVMTSPS